MLNNVYQDAETRMKKCVDNLHNDLTKLRTGRAHTSLLDHIRVSYYGNDVPLNQVGNVGVGDSRTLTITVWDKGAITSVEKAILSSDLGLNPVTHGNVIRVPLPSLTQERRTELVKLVKAEGENARVAVRNVRRDALTHVKELLKNKAISEDDEKVGEDKIQKLTDKFVADIEKSITTKEQELMQV
ncbi:MAG: ribosome recycling factor [Gammaproteobacteria bacterium]|nr:ribosome recycling factor [Gammaproteobacteria bacterium]